MNKSIDYKELLIEKINYKPNKNLIKPINEFKKSSKKRNTIFLCRDGGSAVNVNHIANDFLYGVSSKLKIELNVESLSSNVAVLTCIANDIGYENIYLEQLNNNGKKADILIVLSGIGKSKNICKAQKISNKLQMKTFAISGYSGGKAKKIANYPIHCPVNNMQISENIQMFY